MLYLVKLNIRAYDGATWEHSTNKQHSYILYLMKFYSCSTPRYDYALGDEKFVYTDLFHFGSRYKTLHKLIKQEYL